MAFKVNKPSENMASAKPKLTQAGKIIIGIGVLVVVLLIVFGMKSSANKKKELQNQEPLQLAIERSITVTQNCMALLELSTDAQNQWEALKNGVEKEKDILKKSEKAQEMLSFIIGFAGNDQSVLDELQGAVNRIYVAEKEYKQK